MSKNKVQFQSGFSLPECGAMGSCTLLTYTNVLSDDNHSNVQLTGEVDMKKTIYRVLAWATFVLGVIFIIMPIIPGFPLLVLSASLFALVV